MVDDGNGTETLCILVIIVRGNLTLFLKKTQLLAPSGPSTGLQISEQNDQLTTFELHRGCIQPLTSQYRALPFVQKGLDTGIIPLETGFE